MFTLSTRSFAAAAILAASAFTHHAGAQELDAQVTRDPRANTVTYTIDIDGPPRGTAMLFGGYGLLSLPMRLPFGPLHLNPALTIPLGSTPLDANGKGRFVFQIPERLVLNTNIYFQGLVNDRGILRTTWNYSSCHYYSAPVDDDLTVAMGHNDKTQLYKGEFRGRPGATVELVHYRGSQLDIWQAKIPANGILPICWKYKNKLKHGDSIEIRFNGKQFKTWRR